MCVNMRMCASVWKLKGNFGSSLFPISPSIRGTSHPISPSLSFHPHTQLIRVPDHYHMCVCLRLRMHVYLCPSQGVKEMFLTSPTTKRVTPDLVSDYQIPKCFPYGLSISVQTWPRSSRSHPTPAARWHIAHKWMTSWLVMFSEICLRFVMMTEQPVCFQPNYQFAWMKNNTHFEVFGWFTFLLSKEGHCGEITGFPWLGDYCRKTIGPFKSDSLWETMRLAKNTMCWNDLELDRSSCVCVCVCAQSYYTTYTLLYLQLTLDTRVMQLLFVT